ncbi:MAG: PorV/PorQ family protein [Bacteroidia bacterium]|nr:PorV/PorQ family protein [Bacteroidia bacterium]MDW8302188.1 PorV/PorQ family protein [Bacteroidia bacterium]
MFRNLFGFALLLWSSYIVAQTPKYSNEFMSIGVGARALGMAGAYAAVTNDVYSGYWNPAGLSFASRKPEFALMHAAYFGNIANFDYIGAAIPIDSINHFGISGIRLGVDDIPNTLDLVAPDGSIDYNRIKSFSTSDYGILLSYSRNLNYKIPGLSVGANAKIIHRNVGPFATAWGFGLDAGAIYKKNGFIYGLMANDITTTFNAWSFNTETFEQQFIQTGNEIPQNSIEITLPSFTFSAAKNFKLSEKFNLLGAIALKTTTDGRRNTIIQTNFISADPKAGIEVGYINKLFLRAGIDNLQYYTQDNNKRYLTVRPNLGAGITFMNFTIDYAISALNFGGAGSTLYTHIFSLKFIWDKQMLIQ